MLIEINLLQQKKQDTRRPIFIMLTLTFIIAIIAAVLLLQIQSERAELNSLSAELQVTKAMREAEELKLTSGESFQSVAKLEAAILFAEESQFRTVPVLEHLITRLPERGFIQSWSYNEDGSIRLLVQFDAMRDAAFYLTELTRSNWIKETTIQSVSTSELDSIVMGSQTPIPRYLADYELTLDKEAIQAESEETDEEGGKG